MKDKTKKIIYLILAVVLLIIAIALIANTEWFRKWRLEKKLSDKYGVSFNLKADEQEYSQYRIYDLFGFVFHDLHPFCSW